MVNDSTRDAALARHRFGLGPRPGTIAAIASDPRGALLAELERPGIGRIDNPELLTSAQAARAAFEARAARQAQQIVAQRAQKEAERLKADSQKMGDDAGQSTATSAPPAQAEQAPTIERQIILKEIKAKLDAALAAEIGFAERLVWFWSNHFCVSAEKVPNMAGGYEREAIRPHVLGRYVDMLLAVEGHPAIWSISIISFPSGPTPLPASIAHAASTRISRARYWSCTPWVCAPATARTMS